MANDFSGDASVVSVYRFEDGALAVDSIGTNTLTLNDTPTADTVNFKEGAASADFEASDNNYCSRADADLSSNFPGKSGTSNQTFSICAWIRAESTTTIMAVASKYNTIAGGRTFACRVDHSGATDVAQLLLGYNGGSSVETVAHASDQASGTWYHITWSYQNSDKSWAIRVRDADGNVVGTDATGTATLDAGGLYMSGSIFEVSGYNVGSAVWWDGNIDELVVFNRKIAADESTQIALGTFGAGVVATWPGYISPYGWS